jgi:hypothetical protein
MLIIAGCAILLLRWIPFPGQFVREFVLLAFCLAIVAILRSTPFALLIGVTTALVTPAVPLRTMLLPVIVLIVAALVRRAMPRLTVPALALVAAIVVFFPWSGIVARATPYFFETRQPATERHHVNQALAASRSLVIDVPEGAQSLIVSGANVPGMMRGTPLGRMEPGGVDIRIGDAADWGYMRRESFYAARNPLPRDPAGQVRGYGYSAWVDGAGRVPLPRDAKTIRVTGDSRLPAGASLQVEAFELKR